MKLLLLPAVAIAARFKSFTALIVRCYKGATLPVLADLNIILKQVRSSSKVLEIVCINALRFVVFVIEWTPLCFKEEDKEIKVISFETRHQMVYKPYFKVLN